MEQSIIYSPSVILSKRPVRLLAACFLALSAASVASGQTQIVEPFNATIPADWVATYRTGTAPNPNDAIGISSGMLRLQRPGTGSTGTNNNATLYYTGSQGQIEDGVLGNFTGSLIVSANARGGSAISAAGVIVGAKTLAYDNSQGYFVGYNFDGLYIYENPLTHNPAALTQLAADAFAAPLTAGTHYSLRVEVSGNELMASLWTADGGTQLGSVSYTAGEAITGMFGLRSSFTDTNAAAFFGNVSLTAYPPIPEPATAALALVGLAALAVVSRRRRS